MQPKQQVQVGPQNWSRHGASRVHQVMMVIPMDANVDEAEDIAQEDRPQWLQ
jgi:hypothetical protein